MQKFAHRGLRFWPRDALHSADYAVYDNDDNDDDDDDDDSIKKHYV